MMVRRLVLGVVACVVGACASDPTGTIDGPISYRSTGGFTGGGDGTPEIRVEASGSVTRAKVGGGMESAMLDAATLDGLHDKVREAQFPALDPLYPCECADDFTHEVTAELDGKVYNVKVDYSATPPQRLMIVISALREISQAPLDWR